MLSQISILAVFAVCAVAQNITVTNYFNLSSVPLSLRSSWCTSQSSVCSTLCSGAVSANTCSNTNLDFSCLCAANNSVPGLPSYLNTIPTFECQSAFQTCIADHPMDLTGQTACKTDIQDTCGSIDSTNLTFSSSTTTSSSASPTATPTSSGSASSVSASTTPSASAKSAATAAYGAGQHYGVGALAAGALAAFGFML